MTTDETDKSPKGLFEENNRLRSEIARLEQAHRRGAKTTELLHQSLKELAGFKRALDESTEFNITNHDGKIIYANESYCQLSGYSKEELFGQNNRIVNSGYHPKEFFEEMWQTLSRGNTWQGEIRNKAKDGSFFWVNTTIVPLVNEEKNSKFYLGIRSNITDKKEIERKNKEVEIALRESEMRYRRVVEDQTEFIIRWSKAKNLTFVNESYCRFFGKTCDEILNTDFIPDIPEEDVPIVQNHLKSLGIDSPVASCEHRVKLPGDRTAWTQWSSRAIFDEQDQIFEIQSVGRDITEQKMIEEKLNKTREELMLQTLFTQRLSALANMAGGICHELNQPLNSITLYAETLKNYMRKQKQPNMSGMFTCLDQINKQIQRASKIIEHMLQFASEKKNITDGTSNIHEIVTSVAELLGKLMESHNIQFINTVDPKLVVKGNQTRIEQVLINLITNAKDAIRSKKFDPEEKKIIQVTSELKENITIIRVIDTGIGVPIEVQHNLLEPFVTTKGPDKGMGLGLSICHGILKEYNAFVKMEKTSKDGTTIKLEFPNHP